MSKRSNVEEPWQSPLALMVHMSEMEAPLMGSQLVPILDYPYRALLYVECGPKDKRTPCDVVVSWGAGLRPENSLTVYASAQDLTSDQPPVWDDITSRGRVGVHDARPVLHFTTVPYWPHHHRFRVMVMLELPNRGAHGIPTWWPVARPGERIWKGSTPPEAPAPALRHAPPPSGGSSRHPAASPMATRGGAAPGGFAGSGAPPRAGQASGGAPRASNGGTAGRSAGGGPSSAGRAAHPGAGAGAGAAGAGAGGSRGPAGEEALLRALRAIARSPGGASVESVTQWVRGELAAIRKEYPLPSPADRQGPQELKDKRKWLDRVASGIVPRLAQLQRAAERGLPELLRGGALAEAGTVVWKGIDGFVGQEQLNVTDMCNASDPEIVTLRRSLNRRLNEIAMLIKKQANGWGASIG